MTALLVGFHYAFGMKNDIFSNKSCIRKHPLVGYITQSIPPHLNSSLSLLLPYHQGNIQYKKGQYELAEESYTMAMELDPLSAVMPANRAMARLKLKR